MTGAPSSGRPPSTPETGAAAADDGARLRDHLERALLDHAGPVYVADPAGTPLLTNAAYRELLDVGAAEATAAGGSAPRLVSPGAHERVRRELVVVEIEETVGSGNAARYFRAYHFPIKDDGGLVAVGGIYHDISREKGLNQRIAHIQERYDDITRLVSDWVWEVDGDFNFTFVSARVMEVFSVHPRLLLGSNLFDLGEFDESDDVVPDRKTRTPFRDKVFRVVGADGRARLCRLSGMPVFDSSSGAFAGYRGTGHDITAQVEAESRASHAQNRLAEAIESSSEAFALFDRHNRLSICNSKYREYHPMIADLMVEGVRYEELMRAGAERGEFVDAKDNVEAWVTAEIERQRNPQGAYEQRLSSGRWLKVSDRRTEDGSTVCLRTDITELKEREQALRRAEETSRAARESAEVANRSKSEFLASISHELRTPLNAIIGFSEVMISEMFGPVTTPQYKEYIKDIHESGTHLYSLINDILDVAKAEAGKLDLYEEEIDVADTVDRCLRLIKERAERAEVAIVVDIPPDLPRLWGDTRKVKQILLNLLSNAVKFTPAGGSVTTRAAADRDGSLRLSVSDTGIGIDKKDLDTVMEPFGQVDSTLSRKYEGTGLGLPLTKALVELHDGRLILESEAGVGTTVTVRFPKERVRPA